MKKIVIGIIIGLMISGVSFAYRTPKPIRLTDYDEKNLVALNTILNQIWDLTNGRFNLNVVNFNPDGSTIGVVGDIVLFNDSGTYYLEINTNGDTEWQGVLLQNLP